MGFISRPGRFRGFGNSEFLASSVSAQMSCTFVFSSHLLTHLVTKKQEPTCRSQQGGNLLNKYSYPTVLPASDLLPLPPVAQMESIHKPECMHFVGWQGEVWVMDLWECVSIVENLREKRSMEKEIIIWSSHVSFISYNKSISYSVFSSEFHGGYIFSRRYRPKLMLTFFVLVLWDQH